MSRYSPALVLLAATLLTGCGGGTAALKSTPGSNAGVAAGQLTVSSPTIDFANVAIGNTSVQTGTLTANASAVAISAGTLVGQSYSISGITFPLTLMAGQSVRFTVTFAPKASGAAMGSISFISNASNSPTTERFTGMGTQGDPHSVALFWDPSPSAVIGYNVYRGTKSGGPYPLKLTSSPQSTTGFVDNTVASGTTYYYVATAVDGNSVESPFSNQITMAVP